MKLLLLCFAIAGSFSIVSGSAYANTNTMSDCVNSMKESIVEATTTARGLSEEELEVLNDLTEEQRKVAYKLAGINLKYSYRACAETMGLRHNFSGSVMSIERP